MVDFFDDVLRIAARIQADASEIARTPAKGKEPRTNEVLEPSWFRQRRHGRLIPLVRQINGTYENGWYDACAAMLRRLIETLIIGVYIDKQIEDKIKNGEEFLQLSEIIEKACKESCLELSRDNKRILRDIAKLGNTAAHNRVINLKREYLERRIVDIQILVQHFMEI